MSESSQERIGELVQQLMEDHRLNLTRMTASYAVEAAEAGMSALSSDLTSKQDELLELLHEPVAFHAREKFDSTSEGWAHLTADGYLFNVIGRFAGLETIDRAKVVNPTGPLIPGSRLAVCLKIETTDQSNKGEGDSYSCVHYMAIQGPMFRRN